MSADSFSCKRLPHRFNFSTWISLQLPKRLHVSLRVVLVNLMVRYILLSISVRTNTMHKECSRFLCVEHTGKEFHYCHLVFRTQPLNLEKGRMTIIRGKTSPINSTFSPMEI